MVGVQINSIVWFCYLNKYFEIWKQPVSLFFLKSTLRLSPTPSHLPHPPKPWICLQNNPHKLSFFKSNRNVQSKCFHWYGKQDTSRRVHHCIKLFLSISTLSGETQRPKRMDDEQIFTKCSMAADQCWEDCNGEFSRHDDDDYNNDYDVIIVDKICDK